MEPTWEQDRSTRPYRWRSPERRHPWIEVHFLLRRQYFARCGTLADGWHCGGNLAAAGHFSGLGTLQPGYFNTIGSYTYFRATSPAYGHELWRTDGSTAGTVRLTDINPGALDSVAGPLALRTVELGGDVFFSATDGSGTELWRLNPSTLGLVQVGQIAPGPEDPQASIVGVAGTKLFLSATTAATGSELWVSDGDSTPTLVVDLKPGSASSYAGSGSVVVGSLLYFWL
jgi:ELWxxDGT repeat protein